MDQQKQQQQQQQPSSTIFSRVTSILPNPFKGDDTVTTSSTSAEHDDEDDRNDNILVRLLGIARRKFMDRGIDGSILVSLNIGTSTRSVECEMKSSNKEELSKEELDASNRIEEDIEELSRIEKLASSSMDFILNSLEKRAIKWKNIAYYKDLTLTNEQSLQMPFFRILGITVSFSATVESLIISKYNKLSGVV
jgi:hypothetical protein